MWTSVRASGLVATALVVAFGAAAAGPYDGWKPHAYCNDLEQIKDTKISPLTPEQQARVASLEQVQLVARHGGRAPYARVFCWDKAHHNPVEGKWSCGASIVSSQDIGYKSKGYGRLYSKVYMDGGNILHGNCVVGALLPIGRQQHLINGQYLRDAYIGDGALKLFADDDLKNAPAGSIYLRSDDQERTVGSGHALVDGLFPPEESNDNLDATLTWHTYDYAQDFIGGIDRICPMMGYIGNLSNNSPEFKKHQADPARVKLEKDFQNLVGNFSWDSILECLSIARCNDLQLPAGVDEEMFTNVFHEVEVREGLYLTYNNSWYAKVTMQPLVAEILDRLDPLLNGSTAPRLAITMAHDSTIMPLLAAIQRDEWDRMWTPYAGMLVIEVYKLKAGSHAARLLFQGQPLRIPECADTLCDIDSFLKALEFGRTPRDCNAPDNTATVALASGGVNLVLYLAAFLVIGVGSFIVFLAVRTFRERRRRRADDERGSLLG